MTLQTRNILGKVLRRLAAVLAVGALVSAAHADDTPSQVIIDCSKTPSEHIGTERANVRSVDLCKVRGHDIHISVTRGNRTALGSSHNLNWVFHLARQIEETMPDVDTEISIKPLTPSFWIISIQDASGRDQEEVVFYAWVRDYSDLKVSTQDNSVIFGGYQLFGCQSDPEPGDIDAIQTCRGFRMILVCDQWHVGRSGIRLTRFPRLVVRSENQPSTRFMIENFEPIAQFLEQMHMEILENSCGEDVNTGNPAQR